MLDKLHKLAAKIVSRNCVENCTVAVDASPGPKNGLHLWSTSLIPVLTLFWSN